MKPAPKITKFSARCQGEGSRDGSALAVSYCDGWCHVGWEELFCSHFVHFNEKC